MRKTYLKIQEVLLFLLQVLSFLAMLCLSTWLDFQSLLYLFNAWRISAEFYCIPLYTSKTSAFMDTQKCLIWAYFMAHIYSQFTNGIIFSRVPCVEAYHSIKVLMVEFTDVKNYLLFPLKEAYLSQIIIA